MIGFRNAGLLDSTLHEPIHASSRADETGERWTVVSDKVDASIMCMKFFSQQRQSTMIPSPLEHIDVSVFQGQPGTERVLTP